MLFIVFYYFFSLVAKVKSIKCIHAMGYSRWISRSCTRNTNLCAISELKAWRALKILQPGLAVPAQCHTEHRDRYPTEEVSCVEIQKVCALTMNAAYRTKSAENKFRESPLEVFQPHLPFRDIPAFRPGLYFCRSTGIKTLQILRVIDHFNLIVESSIVIGIGLKT